MSNISQFFAGSRKKNRRIFHGGVGVTTVTWQVPPGVTEVEVHCWGGGGNGSPGSLDVGPFFGGSGGGGGGYVTHVFPVTPSDSLLITAGASPGGTSSVSVPTQSPGSPISATGGSAAVTITGGAGGVGSFTIAPGISTSRTFSASGGDGGNGGSPAAVAGAGGAAGSPFGTGGDGAGSSPTTGGGGIGGSGVGAAGGGSLGSATRISGGLGKNGYKTVTSLATPTNAAVGENVGSSAGGDDWFYVDEILGAGGSPTSIHGGAGGGGATGGNGGILGGGGSTGGGGLAGGGGGSANGVSAATLVGPGGAGLVILYW